MDNRESTDVVRVPLFDGTNFPSWKFRMQVVLEEHECLECIQQELAEVEALRVKPEDDAGARQAKERLVEKRRKKDRHCKSILISRISDSMLEYVQDQDSPRKIWLALNRVFERKTVATRLHLKRKLLALRHDGGCLQEHFLLFDRVVREYKNTGAVLDDLDIVCHLLLTLGPAYETVVTAIETMPEDNLSIEFVKCRLLDEELKCRGKSEEPSGSKREPAAFAGKPKVDKKWRCFVCHELGHKAAECPQREKKSLAKKEDKKHRRSSANVSEKRSVCFVAGGESTRKEKIVWYADSGASEHMSNDKSLFETLVPLEEPIDIAVALNGKCATAKFSGSVKVLAIAGNDRRECTLENVLYSPDLRCNLFSIRKVEMAGMEVLFKNGVVKILQNSEVLASGKRRGFQYEMDFYGKCNGSVMYSCGKIRKCNELWHRRFGHLSEKNLNRLMKDQIVKGLEKCISDDKSEIVCESCIDAKQTRKPFGECTERRSTRVLEIVHSDVCGPISPVSHDGCRYYVSFVDDWSRFTIIYGMRSKDEVLKYFKQYEAIVTAKFGVRISRLRSDNGGEYKNKPFELFCKQKGIEMQCTIPYSPEQNGVSERMNRTLVEKARSMLFCSKVDKAFWCEAIETAAFLVNRSPASAVQDGKTPYEMWEGRRPDVSMMRVWGSPAYCHIPKEHRRKLDQKSWKGIFLGYHCNGYRVWDPLRKKVVAKRDVIIDESGGISGDQVSEKGPPEQDVVLIRKIDDSDNKSESDNEQEQSILDHSNDEFVDCDDDENGTDSAGADEAPEAPQGRKRAPPAWHKDYEMNFAAYALSAVDYVEDFPATVSEMKKRDDWKHWETAVKEEMSSHEKNNTWTLTKLPEGRKPVSCKWVFKIKRGEDGAPDRYKARLVARGFSQRYGYDYAETYAPVARLDTVRTLLAVANQKCLQVHQLDVKTAFLNGTLQEEIFMEQPDGFRVGNGLVCRLNRALYGLKQASRAWNERFHQYVSKLGFKRSENDRCLYIKKGERLFLLLYVDDILIAGEKPKGIEEVKCQLKCEFEMSDLGDVKCFLGMRIERNIEKQQMKITQRSYLESLLRRFGMEECKPVSTPLECHLKLKKGTEAERTSSPYRELVGCLAYVALTTRPDLCAAVNMFSQYQSCPTAEHWCYLKRVLRYVKGTLDVGLEFIGSEQAETMVIYSDADWGNDINDRRSISGYIVRVFGGTVAWLTRKQQTVALSSTEAEFVALCTGVCEGVWMRRLLLDFGVVIDGAVKYLEDNQSCIRVSEEPRDSRRMKHVDIKFNFIRELVQEGQVVLVFVPSEQQLADIMTKGLPSATFKRLREGIGVL